MAKTVNNKIPVTIVSGFLGSGKTTLINHILRQQHDRRVAVIVNEFGEIGIDGQSILEQQDERLVEFNNGCLCCTIRDDLAETLANLAQERKALDGVLVETTGLADPAPVASTFFVSEEVRSLFQLDSFVTVTDAFNLEKNLGQSHEAVEQVVFADIILINKTDLVKTATIDQIKHRIHSLNPIANIYCTQHSQIDLAKIIGIEAFDLDIRLKSDPSLLEDLSHKHDPNINSFVIRTDQPIEMNRFLIWINSLTQEIGEAFYRSKGFFYAYGFPERILFQSVRMLTSVHRDRRWHRGELKRTEFVVIGRGLDRQTFEEGFRRCIRLHS